ncbi:MAG: GNAT family N-acetyltransferase, partial [Oscillochloris sp.]|nr:GNAT family N-acetyltransferase [Oscillochloris sp.]
MTNGVSFASAATLSLEALADLFTRSFEGYFYPGTTTTALLARRVRTESIDLLHSPIVLRDDVPVGIALVARRDRRAWCGGFGIT